jgi:hypothetical protein
MVAVREYGLVALVFGALGALIRHVVGRYSNRVQQLDYTVVHDRAGISAEDEVFGRLSVLWQNQPVQNLWVSMVTIENNTSRDYEDITFRMWAAPTTNLLNARADIDGIHVPRLSPEFEEAVRVPAGGAPTAEQTEIFRHNREFLVRALNRGGRVRVGFWTTVIGGQQGPAIWVATQHPGVTMVFRPLVAQIHGVPVKAAVSLGLALSILFILILAALKVPAWPIVAFGLLIGLFAQSIGAGVYRFGRWLKRMFLR